MKGIHTLIIILADFCWWVYTVPHCSVPGSKQLLMWLPPNQARARVCSKTRTGPTVSEMSSLDRTDHLSPLVTLDNTYNHKT